MTKLKYLQGRDRLHPTFQKEWDARKGITRRDLRDFARGDFGRLTKEVPKPTFREWRGLTTELQAADDAMLSSYSWMLLIVAVIALVVIFHKELGL